MTEVDVQAVEQITIDSPQFVLYSGKGGVGKTTMAAATGLAAATAGHRTLVVSTDPAHSLADIYQTPVRAEPDRIHDNLPLYAVEIDPQTALSESPMFPPGGTVGPFEDPEGLAGFFDPAMAADIPGADEAAALHQLLRFLDDDRYDRIVIDTAPTGHTLRLLELPEMMDSTLGRLLTLRDRLHGMIGNLANPFGSDAPDHHATGENLRDLREQIERLSEILRDPALTDFRIVLIPETLSVTESRRLLAQLDEYGIPVETIVVNRILEAPRAVTESALGFAAPNPDSCEFCRSRWKVQQEALEGAHDLFRGHNVKRVPLFGTTVHGMDMLRVVAACLGD